MPRSASARRERREAVANGAARKPPETFQPSERAAAVRLVMHETVAEQMEQMREAMRPVKSVPLCPPERATVTNQSSRIEQIYELLTESSRGE
jgi:hypothetical protein